MRVLFPVSAPALRKDSTLDTLVGFDLVLNAYPEFKDAFEYKLSRGCQPAVLFGGSNTYGDGVTSISTDYWKLLEKGNRGSVIPANSYGETRYGDLCENNSVDIIAVSPGDSPLSRVLFFLNLVESGKFCSSKVHWLYGVPNPAELQLYHELFLPFVSSRIECAVCSTCFIYSMFGVSFSEYTGVYKEIPDLNVNRVYDLGMSTWISESFDRGQQRVFEKNAEWVTALAMGKHSLSVYSEHVQMELNGITGGGMYYGMA